MEVVSEAYVPADQRLIDEIVRELKSQGIFDQFRKECISDVDTKPAYQNLRQRVENSVAGFLTKQTWTPDMNKNQVREMVRKNIYESGFFEIGVERIVDQVVNPKINTVFFSKVEDVVYKILGIEKPSRKEEKLTTPMKVNTFQDLIPKDSQVVPSETKKEIKEEVDNVKIEDESPAFESFEEKIVTDENSVDSQISVLSGNTIHSHESNHSIKQDSIMSLNSSESRMSLIISETTSMMENTPKIESDDAFFSQKSSDSISKQELVIAENLVGVIENENPEQNSQDIPPITDENTDQEVKTDKNSEEIDGKLKESGDKKRERHQSSSEKSKSRSDKDKSRSDKHKKEEKESSKDQKTEKEKYRIPKLSDRNKIEKDVKSKDKDIKNKEKEKDSKSEKDKKFDKDKKSSKHSSEKDKSKSDRSKRDSKSDKKDKERDEKRDKSEKKESSRTDKSRDEKKSSSKKRDSSSSKDRHSNSKKSTEDPNEKSKNGHVSSTNSNNIKKDSSKPRKEEDKHKSSKKKDDKNDKDDKKRKRDSKDDHYSSKEKNNGRRSSDRDSDGPSNNKRTPLTPQKNSDKHSSQESIQESSCSNMESSSGDSGNSDKIEEKANTLLLDMQKIKLPKFASNLQEAMKIMRIRKQLKKLENANKLDPENSEMKKLLKDIANLTKDTKVDEDEKNKEEAPEVDENVEKETTSININDFISSSNISMAKWNALEAKFMEELSNVDYDSYESPYLDDDSNSVDYSNKYGKIDKTIGKILQEPNQKQAVEEQENLQNKGIDENNGRMESCSTEVDEVEKVVGSNASISENSFEKNEDVDETNYKQKANLLENDTEAHPESSEYERENKYNVQQNKDGNLTKRAVIILEKNSLTEELIKKRKNGEHTKNASVSDKDIDTAISDDQGNILDDPSGNKRKKKEKKIFDPSETNAEKGKENGDIMNDETLDDTESSCKGFESFQPVSLSNLKYLIQTLEQNISECLIKNTNRKGEKHTLQTRNKRLYDLKEASNNNLEHIASKGRKNSLPIKSATPKRTRTNDENIDIPNGFALPLSPAESQPSVEKKNSKVETPNKKLKVSAGHSSGKKSANQRYASEDLYKPRMFLRRSAKNTKNP